MSDVLLHDLNWRLQSLLEIEHDYEAGFALGRHILRYYPRHLATYIQLGMASLAVGLYSDAADLLRRSLSANPEAGTLWAGLRQATTALGIRSEADIARQYEKDLLYPSTARDAKPIAQAIAASSAANWQQALRYYQQAYADNPARMDIALGLATSFYKLERYAACMSVVQSVLDELPYCLKANLLLVRCATELRLISIDTEIHLTTAQSLDPDDILAWYWFGHPAEPAPPPAAMLPDWDEIERWGYGTKTGTD